MSGRQLPASAYADSDSLAPPPAGTYASQLPPSAYNANPTYTSQFPAAAYNKEPAPSYSSQLPSTAYGNPAAPSYSSQLPSTAYGSSASSYSSQLPPSAYNSTPSSYSHQVTPQHPPSPSPYSSAPPSQPNYPSSSLYAPPASPAYPGVGQGGYASPATGIKRALLIGINYFNTPDSRLNGCINDTGFIKFLLVSKYGFSEKNMLVLTDDAKDPALVPTRVNIIAAINWLVKGVKPGDNLVFFFSGHGGQWEDEDGDEEDGMDECIFPSDFKTKGSIVDDELHDILAKPLPAGTKLTCIMDCCHSGSGLDLPYEYQNGHLRFNGQQKKVVQADIVLFSGCADNQTSCDSKVTREAFSGVLTFSFCRTVETGFPRLNYASMVETMQKFAQEKGFKQTIQFSAGKDMDVCGAFSF